MIAIIDCYTDEPSGLGVPPYLGTYPRYLAGSIKDVVYFRIDDLRTAVKPPGVSPHKTQILTYNKTKNAPRIIQVLSKAKAIIVIAGIHTPGKYLSAMPGTVVEASRLLKQFKAKKVLTGPAAFGSSNIGGKIASSNFVGFDEVVQDLVGDDYENIANSAIQGAHIVKDIPGNLIVEIETSKGCSRKQGCSFCTEPLKSSFCIRPAKDVIAEVKVLKKLGVKHIRLGKQADFYAHPEVELMLKEIGALKFETFHIDNVNPASVVTKNGEKITKLIAKHCTAGNIASFGVESFDPAVIKANNLNSTPEMVMKAIKIINKYGAKPGKNGMPIFLPGINLLLGLINESALTFKKNLEALHQIMDSGLFLRRINIRQVDVFPGTPLAEFGLKYLKKNKKHYFRFNKQVREQIDHEMLKKIAPVGTILKDLYTEIHDGKTTFCRQFGTYPLIVGIKEKLPLGEKINVKIVGHMLRSLVGELQQSV